MTVPPTAALIEAEVNALLQQIFTVQTKLNQVNANRAHYSDEYQRLRSSDPLRAQAAAAAYQKEEAARF